MAALDIIEQLETACREAGPINHIRCISSAAEALRKMVREDLLHLDVYWSHPETGVESHPFHPLFKSLGARTDHDFRFRLLQADTVLPDRLGEVTAAAAIVVLDEAMLRDTILLQALEQRSVQYSWILVLNFTGDDRASRAIKFDFYGKWIELIDMSSMESLADYLRDAVPPPLRKLLQERTLLNALKPAVGISKELIQKEIQLLSFQKNLNVHLTNDIRRREGEGNVSDLGSTVRNLIQNWSTEHEKSIRLKYEELNKPNTGRYSNLVAKLADELQDLRRDESAEKSEKLMTSVDSIFLDKFLKRITTEVTADLSNDYSLLMHSLDSLNGKIQHHFLQKGIQVKNEADSISSVPPFPATDKSIKSYLFFNRSYSGEVIKQGATEYFIALREYTGVIMVVAGLLAPLNMIASISQNNAMKLLANGIRIATGVITLVMIVYGYFDLRKRIPLRRVEEFDRELGKAKENLLQEGKKITGDISKDWQGQVSMWLRDVTNQLIARYEKELKQFSTQKQEEVNVKKNSIQKNAQAIDSLSRRLGTAEKAIDGCQRSYRDQLADIEKTIKNATT
jgi:hypothetical protein